MTGSFTRILLPIGPEGAQPHLLQAATVFSGWFDSPVQLVCDEPELVDQLRVLASSLGVPIEPVVCLEPTDSFTNPTTGAAFGPGLVALAHKHAPSMLIADLDAKGQALAKLSSQAVFLMADKHQRRMPVGPLVVEVTGTDGDTNALALAAVLATSEGEPVRLVVDHSNATALAAAHTAENRLRDMGCEAGIDAPIGDGSAGLAVLARTRGATGLVIPADRLGEHGLMEAAAEAKVHLFVAPIPDRQAGRSAPFDIDLSRPVADPPAGAQLQVLDRAECLALLDRHSLARIGYVEAGWPTIVPVNYRLHEGDIFLRTLAGAKLRAAERGDTVCLELDGYDEALRTGWSVVAHGPLEVISDPSILADAWSNDPLPWIASENWRWLRMVPISIAGREVMPSSADQPLIL